MKEMSQKSITVSERKQFVIAIIINVQVPLGVFPLNENKLDEMCQILDRLQVYCPKKRMGNKDKDGEVMIDTLIGGDQLTCARARTSKWLRSSHDDPKFALKALTPVAEDWHTRMCLLKVIQCCQLMVN